MTDWRSHPLLADLKDEPDDKVAEYLPMLLALERGDLIIIFVVLGDDTKLNLAVDPKGSCSAVYKQFEAAHYEAFRAEVTW